MQNANTIEFIGILVPMPLEQNLGHQCIREHVGWHVWNKLLFGFNFAQDPIDAMGAATHAALSREVFYDGKT